MKRCFKCGVEKPLAEFYEHPCMRDRHLNKCKDCTRADAADYSRRQRELHGPDAERRRGRDKYARLYAVGPNWRSPSGTPAEKKAAANAVNNAVRDGRLVKPKRCGDCGKAHDRIHGHHEDYSRPLDVAWVCPPCHRKRHSVKPYGERYLRQESA